MGPGEVGEHALVQGLGLVAGPAPDPALVPGAQRALAPGLLQDLPDGRLAVRPGHRVRKRHDPDMCYLKCLLRRWPSRTDSNATDLLQWGHSI